MGGSAKSIIELDWDGTVNPCCQKAHRFVLGDLSTTPLRDLWNGSRIKGLRRFVRQSAQERAAEAYAAHPCQGCRFIM